MGRADTVFRGIAYNIGIVDLSEIEIDKIIDRCFSIFNKIYEMGLLKGRPINIALVISVAEACKDFNIGITLEQVVIQSGIKASLRTVRKFRNKVIPEIGIRPNYDITEHISPVVNRLGICLDKDSEVENREIIIYLENKGIHSGIDPKTFVATIIYLLLTPKLKISQRELAKGLSIDRKRISRICRRLRETEGILKAVTAYV